MSRRAPRGLLFSWVFPPRYSAASTQRSGQAVRSPQHRGGAQLFMRGLSELGDLFGEVVQPFARAVRSDQPIVAVPRQHAALDIGWVHDDVHVLFDVHRLVIADERPFDEIVALAVAMQALFLGPAVLAHEIV